MTIRDRGEWPARLRALMAEVEAALTELSDVGNEWRVVNVVLIGARTAQKRKTEWAGTVEVRVRMERVR